MTLKFKADTLILIDFKEIKQQEYIYTQTGYWIV